MKKIAHKNNTVILSPAYYSLEDFEKKVYYLKKSAELLNIDIKFYGIGKKYTKNSDIKVSGLLEELEKLNSEYVMMLDSCDTVLQKNFNQIYGRFNNYGRKIVIGAERDIWPKIDISRYPRYSTPYKYINSGFIFGKREELIRALRIMVDEQKKNLNNLSDQYLWHKILMNYKEIDLIIDYKQLLCSVISGQKKDINFVVNKNGICSANEEIYSCVLHFSGIKIKEYTLYSNHIIERLSNK